MSNYNARPHAERVMDRLNSLAGEDPKDGVNRVVFTEGHLGARARLIEWATEAGFEPTVDPIGNLWLMPAEPAPRMLLMGSHVDAVPRGGKFDGTLGVLLALELASSFGEDAMLRGRIAVVDFVAEESSRFGVGTVGSSVFAGRRSLEEGFSLKDSKGVDFGGCRHLLWSDIGTSGAPPTSRFSGYLETHIDQARDLLNLKAPLGIVDAIAAPTRWRIVIEGVQAHAGAAPMDARRDALVAAAHLIVRCEAFGRDFEGGEIRVTVGQLDVRPNAPNVVPGSAEMIVDLRVLQAKHAEEFGALLEQMTTEIVRDREVTIEVDELLSDEPVRMDATLTNTLSAAARELGVEAPLIPSWSVHDALQVAAVLPSAMVTVRNRGGVSHSPGEDVNLNDIAAAYALIELAANRLCVRR